MPCATPHRSFGHSNVVVSKPLATRDSNDSSHISHLCGQGKSNAAPFQLCHCQSHPSSSVPIPTTNLILNSHSPSTANPTSSSVCKSLNKENDDSNVPTIRASRILAIRAARPEVRQLFDIQLERHEIHDDQDGSEAHVSQLLRSIKKAHKQESEERYREGRDRYKLHLQEEMARIHRELPLRDPLDESKNDRYLRASGEAAKKLHWLRDQLDRIWDEEEDEMEVEAEIDWENAVPLLEGGFALRRF